MSPKYILIKSIEFSQEDVDFINKIDESPKKEQLMKKLMSLGVSMYIKD